MSPVTFIPIPVSSSAVTLPAYIPRLLPPMLPVTFIPVSDVAVILPAYIPYF